jgi:hypothetical protein
LGSLKNIDLKDNPLKTIDLDGFKRTIYLDNPYRRSKYAEYSPDGTYTPQYDLFDDSGLEKDVIVISLPEEINKSLINEDSFQ